MIWAQDVTMKYQSLLLAKLADTLKNTLDDVSSPQ